MQNSSPNSISPALIITLLKFGIPALLVIGGSIAKQMRVRAAAAALRKAQEERDRAAQPRMSNDDQVFGGSVQPEKLSVRPSAAPLAPSAGAGQELTLEQRRERQLEELRRRAARKSGTTQVGTPTAPPPQRISIQLQSGGVGVGQARPVPGAAVRGGAPASKPVIATAPIGLGNETPRAGQRGQQQNDQVSRKRQTAAQVAQAAEAQRQQALSRQAISNQKRPAAGRDFAGTSDSHRLVEDTAAAEVTARRGGRKGFTERLGLRNAVVLSEVLGPPRSMQEM